VVRRQRACRAFSDQELPDDLVDQVLDAARFAPSAENRQPWVFVVVRDPDRRRRLTDLMARLWDAAPERELNPAMHDEVHAGFHEGYPGAPVLVVVAGDEERAIGPLSSSIYPAIQNLLLAATALGLGSALTTIASFVPDEVRDVTGLAPNLRPMAIIPLGWPAKSQGPPRRSPVAEIAHRERYGQAWG
jgi:nitroreductase